MRLLLYMNQIQVNFRLSNLIFIFTFMIVGAVNAQNEVEVVGRVIEAHTNTPVSFATVALRDIDSDLPIAGVVTEMDGTFKINTTASDFYLTVSFLGFADEQIRNLTRAGDKIDVGTVMLKENQQLLDEVVVTGEKSKMEFQIDKRVFNIGEDISSTGMGALEVLNRVPSVTVNIEGDVSLRGSTGVQILIDGKPSILADDQSNALGSITADMIEKVEVITNPSAKYDAEGTSGILNIVLKKEEKKGLNGSVSLNTGVPDNHSIGISLNRRTEKFNLFTQLGAGYRSLPRESENINRNLIDGTRIENDGTAYRNEAFYNVILGADYFLNQNNVITLSGNFAYEVEDQPSETNFRLFDESNQLVSRWNRKEITDATNPKWSYELQYKKDFKDHKEHDLIFSALGRFFGKDQSSSFDNTFFEGVDNLSDQETRTNFSQADYTFKLDYTNPITDKLTIETGTQYVINNVGNDFAVFDLINNEPILDESLTNDFEFEQRVLGIYGTGSYKFNKWGVKLGLRVENTEVNTFLVNTSESNDRNYTDLFPSASASYKVSEEISFQGGYSRRIYRPRLWDLNPFFNFRNNFNIRVGNPNLRPEYTDSYEITAIYILGAVSFNSSVYFRNTTDVIERVAFFENNITTTTPINIGINRVTGLEINAEYEITKWLNVNGDFNYNRFRREGSLESQVFDFEGDRYTARMAPQFKLPKDLDIELTGNFQSGFLTVQGEVSPTGFLDVGVRKGFLKKKAVISLGVRDVFASRFDESVANQEDFNIYSFNQRGRFVTLGFSYGFGKGEAMTYSGSRRY
ncbi:MAG: outer membrane beta-barrel family protein [Bacteroidota bacterium]